MSSRLVQLVVTARHGQLDYGLFQLTYVEKNHL